MVRIATEKVGPLVPLRLERPVVDGRGAEVGTLEHLFVDLDHNRIAYATLQLDGGYGEAVALPWPELRQNGAGAFLLDVDPEMMRGAPRPDELADGSTGERRLRELYLYYGHVPYRGRPMR